MSEPQVNVGELIYNDIENNHFLNQLHHNLLCNYAAKLLALPEGRSEVDLSAALRFADLLSKSTHPTKRDQHKIFAQELALLCHALYPGEALTQTYIPVIFSTLGNYPALKHLNLNVDAGMLNAAFDAYQAEYLTVPGCEEMRFFAPQKQIYDRLETGKLSFSAPTSLGKSFIMRTFIENQVKDGVHKNFAIIVPSKALINETRSKLIAELGDHLARRNYRVVSAAGDIVLEGLHNFIFVLTPERLLYLLIGKPNIRFDYVFFDESHKLTGRNSRAPFYYQVVTILQQRTPAPKFVFASPNVPNPEVFLRLLGQENEETNSALATQYSPVTQFKFLFDQTDGSLSTYNDRPQSLTPIARFQKRLDLSQLITYLAAAQDNPGGTQTLVYHSSKEQAIKNALAFAETQKIKNDSDLNQLAMDIARDIHSEYYLAHLIRHGVAYHLGYLPPAIRERIEEQFRAGKISTLFCTSTLLEGVNLPADNLIITKNRNGTKKLTPVDFKNLVGRVGRITYNLSGNVFVITQDDKTRAQAEELFRTNIAPQQLSIETNPRLMSSTRKKLIVDTLLKGEVQFKKNSGDTKELMEMKRKFGLILLRDITEDRDSLVRQEFKDHLTAEREAKIREAFNTRSAQQDDDINISVDQSEALTRAIKNGLTYPPMVEGRFDYAKTLDFLYKLAKIFKWELYEPKTLGRLSKQNSELTSLRWYALLLIQWMEGHGLQYIMERSLRYYRRYPDRFFVGDRPQYYNDGPEDRNHAFASVLDNIEHVILFSLTNYFLKFSNEYKRIHGIEQFPNDWYEYVEYGTTREETILLQRLGFSRESATYIRLNIPAATIEFEGKTYLNPSLLECSNLNVQREAQEILYNVPGVFNLPHSLPVPPER